MRTPWRGASGGGALTGRWEGPAGRGRRQERGSCTFSQKGLPGGRGQDAQETFGFDSHCESPQAAPAYLPSPPHPILQISLQSGLLLPLASPSPLLGMALVPRTPGVSEMPPGTSPHLPGGKLLTGPSCEHEWASQVALAVKNPPANAGDIRDVGSIPGSEIYRKIPWRTTRQPIPVFLPGESHG